MKFNRNQAKTLTNAKELEIYDMARAPKLNKLTVKELLDLVKRSRALRDKLRDVKRTQVRSSQAKAKARGAVPADRSREKAALFSEVHSVFVARLEKVQAAESKKVLASAARVSKAAPAKNKGKARSAKATSASKAAINPVRTVLETPQAVSRKPDPTGKVESERIARSGMTRQRGHLSSQNKRKQGKRDSK